MVYLPFDHETVNLESSEPIPPVMHHVPAIALVVGLFALGLVSPGPNFLVVVERSMASGFRGGFVTGLGVALGDGLYAAAGLFGVSAVISQVGWLFTGVKIAGGLYIAWIGGRMILRGGSGARSPHGAGPSEPVDHARLFRLGLFTDLSNPKTVVFFTSIFAATYDPALPGWVAAAMWSGILGTSIAWRAGLAVAFSRRRIRALYRRFRRRVETLFGGLLVVFGLRLAVSGRPR